MSAGLANGEKGTFLSRDSREKTGFSTCNRQIPVPLGHLLNDGGSKLEATEKILGKQIKGNLGCWRELTLSCSK